MADASSSLGSLFVELTAQFQGLTNGLNEAKNQVKKHSESISESLESAKEGVKHLAEAFAVYEIAKHIAEFVKETMEANKALGLLSKETGIAIEALAGLKFAADKVDIGDEFSRGIVLFGKALREAKVEGSGMALVFQQMGVDANQELLPAFKEVTEKFKGYKDGVDKMGLATELFGTRNAKFVNLLSGGNEELEKQAALFKRLSGIDQKHAAEVAEEYDQATKDLKESFKGLATVFYEQFVPALTEVVEMISTHNASFQEGAKILGTFVAGAIHLAVAAYQDLLIVAKMVIIGANKLTIGWLEGWKMALAVITGLANATINGVIAGMNLGIKAINALIGAVPDWLLDYIGGKGFKLGEIDMHANIAAPLQKTLGEEIEVLKTANDQLTESMADNFTYEAKVIKEGGEKVKKEIEKTNAQNAEQTKALADQLKKMQEEFGTTKFGLKKDIAGINGNDAASKFYGYQQEVAAAQKQIDDLKKLNVLKNNMTKEQLEKQNELFKLYGMKQKAYADAQNILILNTMQKMNDDMLTVVEAFGGKQSALYKTMFAASKAFAIAESTIKIMQGIASAAGAPWPLNLFAMAQVVAATANIVSSIQAVKLQFAGGKAAGGPVSPDKMFLVGEKGPEMFVPSSAGNIIPNHQLGGGSNVRVQIHNYTDAQPQVTERMEGDERVIEVMFRRLKNEIGSDIKEGKGQISKALTTTFGLRRGMVQ